MGLPHLCACWYQLDQHLLHDELQQSFRPYRMLRRFHYCYDSRWMPYKSSTRKNHVSDNLNRICALVRDVVPASHCNVQIQQQDVPTRCRWRRKTIRVWIMGSVTIWDGWRRWWWRLNNPDIIHMMSVVWTKNNDICSNSWS